MSEPDEYVVARVREALAHDSRANELDVDVRVTGHRLFLTGQVATPERRDAVARVAQEAAPDHDVHNQVTVPPLDEATEVEGLS